MTTIVGAENLTANRLIDEIRLGARFTAFTGCSAASNQPPVASTCIQYIPPRSSPVPAGLRYTTLSLVLGGWTLLLGPTGTIRSLLNNLRGGTDITTPVLQNAEHIFHQDFATPEEFSVLRKLGLELSARKA